MTARLAEAHYACPVERGRVAYEEAQAGRYQREGWRPELRLNQSGAGFRWRLTLLKIEHQC
jgi:hypothetical protein